MLRHRIDALTLAFAILLASLQKLASLPEIARREFSALPFDSLTEYTFRRGVLDDRFADARPPVRSCASLYVVFRLYGVFHKVIEQRETRGESKMAINAFALNLV